MTIDDKNTFSQEQLDALGVSPEVAAQFQAEIEAEMKTPVADPATPPASGDDPNKVTTDPENPSTNPSPAAPPVTPTATGAEAESGDDLTKQYPDGNVPVAALIAERKKRQELEKRLERIPAAQPPAVAVHPVQPVAQPQPAPTPAPRPKVTNERLVQEAIGVWEQNNPGKVFDPINPVHMAEMLENKTEIKHAYDNWEKEQERSQEQIRREQEIQQRFQVEVGRAASMYGDQFDAIDKLASQMLENDPREKMYVLGSYQQGDLQPLINFFAKAAEEHKKRINPQPITKTDADKIDEINALPRSTFLPTGEKGKTRTMADIEKMIADGSWAKLPEAERSIILDQVGGGAIS